MSGSLQNFLEKERIKYNQKACIMSLANIYHNKHHNKHHNEHHSKSKIITAGPHNLINKDSHYRLGGMSITIITIIILIFADKHKLKIDDTIYQYLPRVPNSNKITIRQLCNSTAGLPNYGSDPI